MKRWRFVLMGTAALLLTAACEQKKPAPAAHVEQPAETAAKTEPITETDPYASDPLLTTPRAATPRPEPAPAPEAARPAPAPRYAGKADTGTRTHIVKKGETLSSIAKQYYGNANRWRDIWKANKDVVPDPKKLKVGTRLVIP